MALQFLCRTTVNLVQDDSQSGLSKSFRHNNIGHLEVKLQFLNITFDINSTAHIVKAT